MYADGSETLTMDYVEVVCNGKAPGRAGKKEASSSEPSHRRPPNNLNWLIYTLYARHDHELCKTIIGQQMRQLHDKEYLYFVKGLIARDEGDTMESLKCLQKAIEINPSNENNYKEIGRTLFEMGRWKQSLDALLKAEALLARPDAQVCYYIGELLYRNVDHPQLQQKNHPQPPDETEVEDGAQVLPLSHVPKASTAAAKSYYHQAIVHGKHVGSYLKLAAIYKEESNYPRAIEMLESTLQLTPENPEVLTDIGILYLKVNDSKRAFEKLFDVTKLNERYAKALIALGAILQSKNDVDGALNKYKLIDTSAEDSAELWNNIGLCFYKKRKFIAAIACLKKAVWMSPMNFNCLYNLGLVYLTAHQYASAYYTFATAVNLRGDHAECYMLLGICLKNLNDPSNAYIAFERAAMMSDAIKNPLIYLNFAIYCYETGNYSNAQIFLGNLVSMAGHMKLRNEYIKVANTLRKYLPEPVASERPTPLDEAAEEFSVDVVVDPNPMLVDPETPQHDGDLV